MIGLRLSKADTARLDKWAKTNGYTRSEAIRALIEREVGVGRPKKAEVMPTEAEAEESYQDTLYDQACLLLESMASETRQRFFAHIRKAKQKWHA
jgi:hypothetical protein